MLLTIPQVIDAAALRAVCAFLDAPEAAWVDGRVTAGYQGAQVKNNRQIDERSHTARECQQIIVSALERNPLFISAALPNTLYPPMFNRYEPGMAFGAHVDGSMRIHPHSGAKLRTDVSATLFLSDPADYEGGELHVVDTFGTHNVKLTAGDMVLYPATSLHQVTPVTRGTRTACFFWVQSLVREDGERALLFELDTAIQQLNLSGADEAARRSLIGCYHNLMRKWSDT